MKCGLLGFMKRLDFLFFLIWLPALCMFSCHEVEEPGDIGLRYFPLSSGMSWVYQVDSIRYNAFSGTSDTVQFFILYEAAAPVQEENEESVLQIKVYDSSAQSGGWNLIHEVEMRRNAFRAECKDPSGRMVKLVFPVVLNKRWNSNMYQEEIRNVRYSLVEHVFNNGFISANDCITITEKSDSNFFQNEQMYEVYASGIGMIYGFARETETQNERTSGYHMQKTLIRYQP